jgi:hypothetical protein
MSLKAFHLFFIGVSIVLAAFTAAWATGQYRAAGELGYLATAAGGVLAGIGLAVSAARFQKKVRQL